MSVPRNAVTLYLLAAWFAFALTANPVMSVLAGVPAGLLYASVESVQS